MILKSVKAIVSTFNKQNAFFSNNVKHRLHVWAAAAE